MEFTAKPSALTAQDVLEILKGVDIEREMDDPERKLMAADSLFVALRKSNPKMEIHFILAKWVFEGGGENGEPHSQAEWMAMRLPAGDFFDLDGNIGMEDVLAHCRSGVKRLMTLAGRQWPEAPCRLDIHHTLDSREITRKGFRLPKQRPDLIKTFDVAIAQHQQEKLQQNTGPAARSFSGRRI
jgi:hypothetical protein